VFFRPLIEPVQTKVDLLLGFDKSSAKNATCLIKLPTCQS